MTLRCSSVTSEHMSYSTGKQELGKYLHRCNTNLLFASETIASNDLPHLFFLFNLWIALHHVLQRRQIQIQLLGQVLK